MSNSIVKFDFKGSKQILSELDWSRSQNKRFSNLHSLASYLAMFCPALPSYFINKYSAENDLVMDNFSGRGTTALVCRELKRNFVGNDLNPYAYVLSKLKVSTIWKTALLKRIDEIENEFNNWFKSDNKQKINIIENNEVLVYYSKSVYNQLFFLREKYGKNWIKNADLENAIIAFALSLMHGPIKKDSSTIYFSLSMPNTISMAPNYVKKFALSKKLIKPEGNIFEKIKNRVLSKFDDILEKEYGGKIYFCDSTKPFSKIKNESVSLVVTSPPYLNMVNYTNSNWLKLWLLGYERIELNQKIKLSDKFNFEKYCEFIFSYLNNIYPLIKKGGHICLIVGDVYDKELILDVWNVIKDKLAYEFVEIYYDYKYLQTHKVTHMLNSKIKNGTKIEKVLVLRKG
ncbi:MAG: DNA methylase [Malacoplasma sp.]|nr:DNA methylase [Malacoplasma sp.]